MLTIGLLPGALGGATLKGAYRLVAGTYREAIPRLPSYAQWLARLHALAPVVGMLVQAAVRPLPDALYLMDSKPIPVCKPLRHGRARLLREEGAYFGKTSAGWFFGFKLHLLTHHDGAILSRSFTGLWNTIKLKLLHYNLCHAGLLPS